MESSWFLACLFKRQFLIQQQYAPNHPAPPVEYFLISYRVSITESFRSPETIHPRTLLHPRALTGQLFRTGCLKYANRLGLKWAGKLNYTLYSKPPLGWIKEKKKKSSVLSFILIKRRKWPGMPSLCLHALSPRPPLGELQRVNYSSYQPRWWLICCSCLLTMTSW